MVCRCYLERHNQPSIGGLDRLAVKSILKKLVQASASARSLPPTGESVVHVGDPIPHKDLSKLETNTTRH
jgi:hypothetical protein